MASLKDLIFSVGASRVPMSVDAFDRAFRRRILIAIGISVVVNGIVFGAAGVAGHQFLHSLKIMREKKDDVKIRRVFIRDLPGGGIKIIPDNRPFDMNGPTAH